MSLLDALPISTLTLGCNPTPAAIDAALGSATASDLCDGTAPVTPSDGAVSDDNCTHMHTSNVNSTYPFVNSSSTSRTISWKVDTTAPVITATGEPRARPAPLTRPTCAATAAAPAGRSVRKWTLCPYSTLFRSRL